MVFAAIFLPTKRACSFDISADRNAWQQLADRLRSSAIIWKQLSLRSSALCDLRSAIVCDQMEISF